MPHDLAKRVRTNAQVADEQVFCYERNLMGFTHREIAAQFEAERGRKVSAITVRNRITAECATRVNPLQDEWRQMAIDRAKTRLIRLHARLSMLAPDSQGSLQVENLIANAEDMLNKIMGTYAAEKVAVTVEKAVSIDDELERLASKLGLSEPKVEA